MAYTSLIIYDIKQSICFCMWVRLTDSHPLLWSWLSSIMGISKYWCWGFSGLTNNAALESQNSCLIAESVGIAGMGELCWLISSRLQSDPNLWQFFYTSLSPIIGSVLISNKSWQDDGGFVSLTVSCLTILCQNSFIVSDKLLPYTIWRSSLQWSLTSHHF